MTITQSSTRLATLVAGVAVALSLMVGAFTAAPAQAASLTQSQISSIVSLLQSFGADAATIANVQASLNGQATPGTGTGTGTGTGGACPALSRSLQLGSTGVDVKALQVFLNAKAATQVSVSGAGSPGLESTYFGPATKAAVTKFQTLNNVSAIGVVGPATRAAIAAVCGGTSTGGGTTPTGPGLSISAGAQPANALAPAGASRVPFTTFTLTNNSGVTQTVNGVTVERTGLAVDSNISGVTLVDSANNLQLGVAKTLNSSHQATVGDTFTINPGQTMTLTVAGNIAAAATAQAGQIVSLKVVAVNTSAPVSGSLPIMGASHTINTTLTLGSITSTSTSSYDPGTVQNRNIGDVGVRFTGIKMQSGSAEDLKLYSIRWRQVGSGSASDLANVMTYANRTAYAATLDASGKYYTTVFPGGITIAKGNTIDVYVQGDIVGANAAGRTIDFDIDKSSDVYFVGQTYGYGISVINSTYVPWVNGYVANVAGGTVTTISKANSGKAAAQNVAINVVNQPMGGFTTNFTGEQVSVQSMIFTIATSSLSATGDSHFTNISLVDENGAVVASGVDATNAASGQTLTFTDTVTFKTGAHTYYLQGKVPSTVTGGSFSVSTTPSSGWSNVTGQSTGNTVSLSSAGAITMNSMTVKAGGLLVSLSTTPSSQNVVAGSSNFTFANVLLDAGQSGEDVRLSGLPIFFASTGSASNVTGCSVWDGSTQLTTGSRVVNSLTSGAKTSFSFDNILRITKGTSKTLSVACNLSSNATSSSTYNFTSVGLAVGDFSITGDTSGVSITPSITANIGGTMTVAAASLAISVDSSSPASTTVSGGTTGQTIAVYKVRATNDTVTLNKIGMNLTSGSAAAVTKVWLYNGATQIGSATFGAGQTVATSTLDTPVTLTADTDFKITVKADFADIGTGKPGTEGAVVQINPANAEGTGSTGLVSAVGSGTTAGARTYNSLPIFTYSSTGATLSSGVNDFLTLNVAADASGGDVGLNKLTFTVATSTITGVTAFTFSGPNGNVSSSTNSIVNPDGTITVYFDSVSNTGDATVSSGSSKNYTLRGTVNGLGASGGSVSVSLKADTSASAIAKATNVSPSSIVWSPLATTSLDVNTNDWTNGYALKGCFSDAGLGNSCTARVLSK